MTFFGSLSLEISKLFFYHFIIILLSFGVIIILSFFYQYRFFYHLGLSSFYHVFSSISFFYHLGLSFFIIFSTMAMYLLDCLSIYSTGYINQMVLHIDLQNKVYWHIAILIYVHICTAVYFVIYVSLILFLIYYISFHISPWAKCHPTIHTLCTQAMDYGPAVGGQKMCNIQQVKKRTHDK